MFLVKFSDVSVDWKLTKVGVWKGARGMLIRKNFLTVVSNFSDVSLGEMDVTKANHTFDPILCPQKLVFEAHYGCHGTFQPSKIQEIRVAMPKKSS